MATVHEVKAESDGDDCPVCLTTLTDADVCTAVCGHRFHLSCMFRLLAHQPHRPVLCPLCRHLLHSPYESSPEDRELLRLVTRQQWELADAMRDAGAQYSAAISAGDYHNNHNVGMLPLHFAVRDHAPLARIQAIYEAYPQALHVREHGNMSVRELLEATSPNYNSYTAAQFAEVKTYLDSLPGEG